MAVNQVLEQLKRIMKGEYITPISEKRKFGTIVFAAIDVHVADVHNLISNVSRLSSSFPVHHLAIDLET